MVDKGTSKQKDSDVVPCAVQANVLQGLISQCLQFHERPYMVFGHRTKYVATSTLDLVRKQAASQEGR